MGPKNDDQSIDHESNGTDQPPAVSQSIVLSNEIVLVYVLRESGARGHLTSGRVERARGGGLDVFDFYGSYFEYFSGERLRSWCVFGPDGKAIEGWSKIRQEDLQRIDPSQVKSI